METSSAYKNHVASMQNLEMFDGRKKYQAPFAAQFEEIYNKAVHSDIKLDSAKSFIEDLSQNELHTLQKYAGLASPIDTSTLTPEGAYNLLMHDREQFDFNADGSVQVGEGRHVPILPSTMPAAERDAFITALNSLDDNEKLMALTLTFDPGRISAKMNGTPYTPKTIDYAYLSSRVQQILNPENGAYTSETAKASIRNFWEAFDNAFEGERSAPAKQERDANIEKFLSDLRQKGALQFLSDLNQEKIEEKVEAFRQKLISEMGDSPEAMAEIEKRVNDYRQQLLEELQESLDNNDNDTPTINEQAMIQMVLDMKNEENEDDPLTSLLHKKEE